MKKIINLLYLLVITSCSGQDKPQCLNTLEERLKPKINQENIQGEIINFRDNVNCIEWDSLVVVMATNNKELIEKYSNFKIPYSLQSEPAIYNDKEAFIFFLKDNKAVNHLHIVSTFKKGISGRSYEFITLQKKFISKQDAIFEVYTKIVTDNQGNTWNIENAIRIKK